eukprot:324774_1
MCASHAPDHILTENLYKHVNYSQCILQNELIELYFTSTYEDAKDGNYDLLGKVIELHQKTQHPGHHEWSNTTRFDEQPPCDIKVRHGWVREIRCDSRGAVVSYKQNLTQFDMLHDIMRYLLPRLQKRLFEGFDIPEHSLFGYSTMERGYDYDSNDHTIHRKFAKSSLIEERYAKSTSDLLWEHTHSVEDGETDIKRMEFSMIHVFTHIPHYNESQKIKLFTWCGYELNLVDKQNITMNETQTMLNRLNNLGHNVSNKSYTIDEWRGIGSGDYMYTFNKPEEHLNKERRRLGVFEAVEKFCEKYNKYTQSAWSEEHIEIYQLQLWISQMVKAGKHGVSFGDYMKTASSIGLYSAVSRDPFVIIPKFLSLDLGFIFKVGFGWNYQSKKAGDTKMKNYDDFQMPKADDDGTPDLKSSASRTMTNCPISFIVYNALFPNAISKKTKEIVIECCAVFIEVQRDCSKTLSDAAKAANDCLKKNGFCSQSDNTNNQKISMMTGLNPYQFSGAPPSILPMLNFVLFFKNVNWDVMKDDFSSIFNLFIPAAVTGSRCLMEGNALSKIKGLQEKLEHSIARGASVIHDFNATILFVQNLGKLMGEFRYVAHKLKYCKIKAAFPITIEFDIKFDLGFVSPTLKDLCSLFGETFGKGNSKEGGEESAEDRRRRLQDLSVSYPIVPEIPLPCIPIAPPELMLCPQISVATDFGLQLEPEINIPDIGLKLIPKASFDITAQLSLTLGIPILNAQVVMGVTVALVVIEFPVDIGINVENAGVFGDISVDIKVIDLTIFLKFKLCLGISIFQICPLDLTLWSTEITAWEYKKQLAVFGMGSHAQKGSSQYMPSAVNEATTSLKIYWAFYDSYKQHNGEFDYQWNDKSFSGFTKEIWATYILGLASCQIKEMNISTTWYNLNVSTINRTINDPYYCKYNFEGFDKLQITEINIQWYSSLGMKTCWKSKYKQIFEEKLCCNFAINVWKEMINVTHREDLKIYSYKMIVIDVYKTWSGKCAQFFINTEVQIGETPYYDDCSDEGWKIAKGLAGEYKIGFHNTYYDGLTHYNLQPTCLNWYNSTRATKTLRTFEVLFPYDFLTVAMKFWGKINQSDHNSTRYYGIKLQGSSHYYWINNVGFSSKCYATEPAYSAWHEVDLNLENVSLSTLYCYTDVLIYIDPLIDENLKYRFNLEIIANIAPGEFWGFSHLVMNTFENKDICVTGINPVIQLTTSYSNITYSYHG